MIYNLGVNEEVPGQIGNFLFLLGELEIELVNAVNVTGEFLGNVGQNLTVSANWLCFGHHG